MYNIIHCIYKDKEDKDEHFFNWTRKSKLQDYKDSKYFLFDRKLLQNSDNQKVLDLKNKNIKEETQRAAIFQDEKGTVWFLWYLYSSMIAYFILSVLSRWRWGRISALLLATLIVAVLVVFPYLSVCPIMLHIALKDFSSEF